MTNAPSPSVQSPVWSVGRRKCSSARVRTIPGSGKVMVNGKTLEDFFKGHPRHIQRAMLPFSFCEKDAQFDFFITVQGGGVTGQADAIRLGISRAFSVMSESTRKVMRKEGLLTRDPRAVERKKSGQPGARKRYQYSKR